MAAVRPRAPNRPCMFLVAAQRCRSRWSSCSMATCPASWKRMKQWTASLSSTAACSCSHPLPMRSTQPPKTAMFLSSSNRRNWEAVTGGAQFQRRAQVMTLMGNNNVKHSSSSSSGKVSTVHPWQQCSCSRHLQSSPTHEVTFLAASQPGPAAPAAPITPNVCGCCPMPQTCSTRCLWGRPACPRVSGGHHLWESCGGRRSNASAVGGRPRQLQGGP
mmetsp:Transcript_18077/g.50621  ORF Transcript_18077/g.50621 Transcript_18077/m.50621 type:complete len:217 (+) Transcript_18077:438-1088(+)